MKIKIYNTNKIVECEPTQEALEAAGVDTFGKALVFTKERTYWLMPAIQLLSPFGLTSPTTTDNIKKKEWIMPIRSYYDYND